MTFWNIFTIIDWIMFILISLTVLYLGVFAITSLFVRHSETPKAKKQNRFISNASAVIKLLRPVARFWLYLC